MSSYIGLSRLIGLRYDDESALRYRQIYPSDMKRGPDGSGIIFNPPGSGEPFTLEELISLQLDNSVSECDGINYPNQALNAVISVPDSYGYREKMVLKTAASLAKKIRLSGIVSHSESGMCIILSHVFHIILTEFYYSVAAYVSGTSKFKKNEKYLIFNSGHLHLCVSAFEVSLTEGYDTEEKVQNSPISITMLASSCTEKFGMENIDLQLLNVVKADLISKNGSMEKDLNDTGHPTYLKLLQKVSKSKHDLSGADLAIMKVF